MWRSTLLVARREYAENVKTKAFIIGVLALPVLLGLVIGVTAALERSAGEAKPFAVLSDGDHGFRERLAAAYRANAEIHRRFQWRDDLPADLAVADADAMVSRSELFAYVLLPADVVASGRASYAARNLAERRLHAWVAGQLAEYVREARFDRAGIDARTRDSIFEPPPELQQRAVTESGQTKEVTVVDQLRSHSPIVFVYFLWIAVMTIAQLLLTNVIEEKSTRVIEVLLSSVSPNELMGGKILGTAATGLTMLACWVATAFAFLHLGLPVVSGMSAADAVDAIALVLSWQNLACFAGYFLAGFLLYAAMFAAVGSLVSSIKEAQNLMTPIVMVMMVPLLTMMFVTRNPHAPLGVVLSYIPPFTPFLMMNRVAAIPPAPWWEVALTGLLLAASVWLAFRLAGRVFRVGILMTGKPPTPREIWRLARGR
jgi:ABC-2 type transport system permease protein